MSRLERQDFDIAVIGAGPAGAAAATILAAAGRRVALIEKDPGPRYCVGESLIPFCWQPLNRLGLVDAVSSAGFVVEKNSVQFASLEGRVSKPFYFFEHTDHPCARTWQVVREEFDQLLVENALAKGAKYFPSWTVDGFLGSGSKTEGVRATHATEGTVELSASVTIDASGRDSFSQKCHGWRLPDQDLRKIAIWSYFEGAVRETGVDEGTTTIAYLPDKGWIWVIPLPDDRMSVGIVAEREYLFRGSSTLEEIFEREVAIQGWVRERLEPARRITDFRVTSDFSYRSKYCAADGLVLVGDAFAFLDPVFSSGVYFALTSGVMAADAVLEALAAGDTSGARFAAYGEAFLRQLEPMRKLVHAFYDVDFNFGTFLKKFPDQRGDLTDCLIGDLERDFGAFFEAISEFSKLPDPLPHGGPLM